DAHTDAYPNDGPGERHRYNPGTTFTCAADEGLVDTGHSLHVGARGPTYEKRAIDGAALNRNRPLASARGRRFMLFRCLIWGGPSLPRLSAARTRPPSLMASGGSTMRPGMRRSGAAQAA